MYGYALLLIVALIVTGSCPVKSAGSSILSQIFADLKQGYGSHLSSLHAEFNKRSAETEDRITLLEKKFADQQAKQAEMEKSYMDLQIKYETLLEEKQAQKRNTRVVMPRTMLDKSISFYAQLSRDIGSIGNYQAIIFDTVTTNNGNAYNKADGIFTAPTSGTYVFSWTTANNVNKHMQTEIVANGLAMGKTWSDSGDHADVTIASNTVVLNLAEGDTVWIRSGSVHRSTLRGDRMSTFSGWFLY